jgi:hypothetical protein
MGSLAVGASFFAGVTGAASATRGSRLTPAPAAATPDKMIRNTPRRSTTCIGSLPASPCIAIAFSRRSAIAEADVLVSGCGLGSGSICVKTATAPWFALCVRRRDKF